MGLEFRRESKAPVRGLACVPGNLCLCGMFAATLVLILGPFFQESNTIAYWDKQNRADEMATLFCLMSTYFVRLGV